jgi:hypothetical protein
VNLIWCWCSALVHIVYLHSRDVCFGLNEMSERCSLRSDQAELPQDTCASIAMCRFLLLALRSLWLVHRSFALVCQSVWLVDRALPSVFQFLLRRKLYCSTKAHTHTQALSKDMSEVFPSTTAGEAQRTKASQSTQYRVVTQSCIDFTHQRLNDACFLLLRELPIGRSPPPLPPPQL